MIRYEWSDLDAAVRGLHAQIKRNLERHECQLQTIVGIHRGGLIPATMLSHLFNARMVPLRWQTRDQERYTEPHTLCSIVFSYTRCNAILVVDDIADSGKTLNDIHRHIGFCDAINPPRVYYATLVQKSMADLNMPILSHTVTDSDEWFHFPWEAD